jgi:glucosamine-6-phosphate deaminase
MPICGPCSILKLQGCGCLRFQTSKPKMDLRIVRHYEALSRAAAFAVASEMRQNPEIVLGLAAGKTPLGTYHELVRMHREEALDFSRTVFFNLDEYGGADHAHSFQDFLYRHLVHQINIPKSNVHFLSFPSVSAESYCESFERDIRNAGGIDFQILGIGRNGHIAFNEPGSAIDSRTRVVNLDAGGTPGAPTTAVTMGIGTILEARRILLLASGNQKAEVLARALTGPVTENIPASTLQRHDDVIVIADEESAEHLNGLKRTG